MADLEALLAAIYAQPDDDAARLVYADALQELGDPRGEFIALQVRGTGGSRARELAKRHGEEWLGALAPIVLSYTFERGFPATVAIDVCERESVRYLAKHIAWSTVHTIELGGRTEGPGSFKGMQRSALRALANAPGHEARTFRPSLDEIEASIAASKTPR